MTKTAAHAMLAKVYLRIASSKRTAIQGVEGNSNYISFPESEINYYGEPIMLVVGPDNNVIKKIEAEIVVEYDILEPLFEYKNSVIHYHFTKGDIKKAFDNPDKIIGYDYDTGYQEQLYIEPQGMIGHCEEGQITLVGSIQCPYYVKNATNINQFKSLYLRWIKS